MIFKTIIIIYCLVGLTYNILLIPRKNKIIEEQNQFILDRYEKMDNLIDKIETKLDE